MGTRLFSHSLRKPQTLLLSGLASVGLAGFEPAASCTRDRRSTKLSHSPWQSKSANYAPIRRGDKDYSESCGEDLKAGQQRAVKAGQELALASG